jgi:hypothetical protein
MALTCCKNGLWKEVKEVTGGQTKGREKERWMDDVELGLRNMGVKMDKNFGQKRMGIRREGSQGRT